MNNDRKIHCVHCGMELTDAEIAADKCKHCLNTQQYGSPPPPPLPNDTRNRQHQTFSEHLWDSSSHGNLTIIGMVVFCVAIIWFIATVWINASIMASAYDENIIDIQAAIEKKQAIIGFIDWTVIITSAVALTLGICAYVKNSSRQKLAVVTMLLSAGLFFALFCFKMREYAWKKSNKAIQENFLQQPPPEIDFRDFD